MKENTKVKNFWEKCGHTFAHLTTDRWLKSKDALQSDYENKFIRSIGNIDGKTIADYGIGGGWLGELLLRKYDIEKYIGIDIATRSINAARGNLSIYDNTEFYLTPVDFSTLNADIFISLATIQHFIDAEYLDAFLLNLNRSNINRLVLQIRHSTRTKFNCRDNYVQGKDVKIACLTNSEYIQARLPKYKIVNISSIYKPTNYQFIILDKKGL